MQNQLFEDALETVDLWFAQGIDCDVKRRT